MDVRDPDKFVRGFPPADGTRTVEGVVVRDALALDELLSCLVGDLDGDLVFSG